MTIVKRNPGDVPQAGAAAPDGVESAAPKQPASPPPPLAAPGVVPPAAAPMYSTRQPEPAARAQEPDTAVAEKMKAAREAQMVAKERMRQALERVRAARPQARAASSPPPQPVPQAPAPPAPRAIPRPQVVHRFDPVAQAQAGLLNLAWHWGEAGAPCRAIDAYMDLLSRYPGTPAAAAAVADLAKLTDRLAEAGQFHTALRVYNELESLL